MWHVVVFTGSVIADNQNSMGGPLAGAVILDDASQVILPAYSIHNSNQRAILY